MQSGPLPETRIPVALTSAEKDFIVGLLERTGDNPKKSGILTAIVRAGMSDGPIYVTFAQADYIAEHLPEFLRQPAVPDAKDYDSVAFLAPIIAQRFRMAGSRN